MTYKNRTCKSELRKCVTRKSDGAGLTVEKKLICLYRVR